MKLVINSCYGGFGLSEAAIEMLGRDDVYDIERDDHDLICVVETLGSEAGKYYSDLEIVEIPDTATDWEIDEYDGWESVTYVLGGKIYHA